MQKTGPIQGRWRNIAFWLAAVLIAVADQLSKAWIRSNLAVGQSLPETGFPRVTHVQNSGGSFGLFQDQMVALIVVGLVLISLILLYALFFSRHLHFLNGKLATVAVGLILGGAVGNMVDRLRFGYVTDFIYAGFWPTFNVADSAVTIGVILIICSLAFSLKAAES